MDVTQQVRQTVTKYGGSGGALASGLSSSRSLNFAEGGSINKPVKTGTVTRLPFTLKFNGSTGLFGSENTFVEINTSVLDVFTDAEVSEGDYQSAVIKQFAGSDPYYVEAVIDDGKDLITENTFEPAEIEGRLGFLKPMYTLRLKNNGSGNKYEDCWLDVRLYTKAKEEHPYDEMLLRPDDKLYVGFHARNTRRLNYDVEVIIGEEFIDEFQLTNAERELIPRVN